MCLSTLKKVTWSDMPYTVTFVMASPTISKVCHILNLLWRQSMKSCFNKTWINQRGTVCVHCTAAPEMRAKPKTIPWHWQNSCMRTWDIPRKLHYHPDRAMKQHVRQKEQRDEGPSTCRLNPCKYWMKCQGKVEAEGGEKKTLLSIMGCLISVLSQEKKKFKELRDLISTISFATGLR